MPSPSSRVLSRVLGRVGLLLVVIVVGSVVTATMVVALVPVGKQVHDAGDLWLDKESDPSSLPPYEARSKVFDSAATSSPSSTPRSTASRYP